jgi:hypothetical protein
VIQDVLNTILGHSSGREINARYTHVELPAKRDAIRKLELWVTQQQKELRAKREAEGGNNDSSETTGETASTGGPGAKSLETKDPG